MTTFTLSTFTAFMLLFCCSAQAQFRGGDSDGATVAIASNQPLGRNFFRGGTDDGTDFALAFNQPLGRNIFMGGTEDGTEFALASNQPLGRNIFVGGVNDGSNFALASNQSLGRNIFVGGTDDGIDFALASNQPLGRNIFTGGVDDGWAMAFAPNLPLPITLADFNGKWQQEDAVLIWKTATELNTSHFQLERSFDGNTFSAITTINAAGQSSTERNYTYTDIGVQKLIPNNGTTVYYRLKSVDKNGAATYSGIVILKTKNSSVIQYAVFPNPAKDFVTISTAGQLPLNAATMRLADVSGKILLIQKITSAQQQFSVSALTNGTYFLQVLSDGKVAYTQKIIIQK